LIGAVPNWTGGQRLETCAAAGRKCRIAGRARNGCVAKALTRQPIDAASIPLIEKMPDDIADAGVQPERLSGCAAAGYPLRTLAA